MTGFGLVEKSVQHVAYRVEIRSLNSKFFDPVIRIPLELKDKETEIRQMLFEKFQRGKIDFNLNCPHDKNSELLAINRPALEKYFNDLKNIQLELGIIPDEPSLFHVLLKLPGIISYDLDQFAEHHWPEIVQLIQEAMEKCDQSRIAEGKKIEEDLTGRIHLIEKFLNEIEPFENQRIIRIREKIQKELFTLSDELQVDKNRFEQELIYYLEKLDITEEKVRLKSHCDFFMQSLQNEDAQGRKLAFIAQEMGREINTLGAKANDHNIQHLVVLMKDELEKIKEQLFNVL